MNKLLQLKISIAHSLAAAEKTGDYSKIQQRVIDLIESYSASLQPISKCPHCGK